MSSKPPKNINSEDRALFRAAVDDIRPLSPRHTVPREPPAPAQQQRRQTPPASSPSAPPLFDVDADIQGPLSYCHPQLSRRDFSRLKRGRYRVEAEIDLHGLKLAEAHQALREFIDEALEEQLRCVRVIHGKGLRSGNRGPVLKQGVNHWLREWQEVLAFVSAPIHDGGTGALHVLLRG